MTDKIEMVGRMAVCSRGRVGVIRGRKALPWGESWVGVGLDGTEWASRNPTLICEADAMAIADFYPLLDQHKIAAVALHGRTFGFTREHIGAIRDLAYDMEANLRNPHFGMADDRSRRHDQVIQSREAADRIEALLPPEGV